MTDRANPCKGREGGCTADCDEGSRCDNCRAVHSAREQQRRDEHRAAGGCTYCGGRVVVVDGVRLKLCRRHRAYFAQVYADRAAGRT